MPTFIGMVLGAAGKTIGMGARVAGAGTVGKMALGAGVGGIYGATQGYDINSAIEGAGKGMALGALGGAAVGLGPGIARLGAKAGWQVGKRMPWGGIGRGVAKTGRFALNHPFLTAGAAVGVMGVTQGWGLSRVGRAQAGYSPTLEGAKMNVSYNQQALAAAELGQIGGGMIGPPGDMQGRFEQANWMNTTGESSGGRLSSFRNSTVGLGFGLHNGRHS